MDVPPALVKMTAEFERRRCRFICASGLRSDQDSWDRRGPVVAGLFADQMLREASPDLLEHWLLVEIMPSREEFEFEPSWLSLREDRCTMRGNRLNATKMICKHAISALRFLQLARIARELEKVWRKPWVRSI